jgi:hypothetical protein
MDWYRTYPQSFIYGKISLTLNISQIGVLHQLLGLASLSYQRRGYIEHSIGLPYTVEELAKLFHCDIVLINETIKICMSDKNANGEGSRIEQLPDGTYYFGNWDKLQDLPDKIKAKKANIEKNKENKKSTLNALRAMTRAINNLTISTQKLDGKIRYVPNPSNPHNEVVDLANGDLYLIEEVIIDKNIASSIASQSDDKGE